jgi:IS4 transposase
MAKELPPLQGFKYLSRVMPLLERLHDCGTKRDAAGNRQLHFDRYVALMLLYFFTPGLTSLRGLAQASALDKVAQATGGNGPVSLGSLSEAPRVFDPTLLRGILQELAAEALPHELPADQEALRDLTAVDGTLLRGLPNMAWAVWQDDSHRAAKAHVAFEVFRAGPADATLTHGNGSEREQLRTQLLKPGRIYVVDRGYESYELLADIRDKGSSFVARVQQDVAFEVQEERPLDEAARAAGVLRDVILKRLGSAHHKDWHKGKPLRLVVVENTAHRTGEPTTLYLLTDKVDWAAELVALAYRYRWSIELFFRWLKSILGCRHLLSHSAPGVAIQVYVALIASVLLGQWSGRKPDKRTFEMFCHFFSGLATEQELQDFLRKQQEKEAARKRKKMAESSA